MTQTPTRAAGPVAGAAGAAGAGDPGAPGGTVAPAGSPAPQRRRTAWAQSAARLRGAATTEPGRLRIIGAVLAALVVAFGAVTAWQITDRQAAAGHVIDRSAPLSANAAEIYRSLADADATVTGGFLVGGQQPAAVSKRYDDDIAHAASLITEAAANSGDSGRARAQISALNEQLPYYTRLVATAQADNRQGLPLGGAYLRYANDQMRKQGGLLDAAGKLYQAETARLGDDYGHAKALPWTAWVLGVLALAALVWAQRRHFRRTNRVFNRGMLAASGACAVVLVWLLVGHTLARTHLDDSYAHGAKSLQVLNSARISVLQARGDENLTLVARGSGEAYDASFDSGMTTLAGKDPAGVGGELARALSLADAQAGKDPVNAAIKGVRTWRGRHTAARSSDDGGDYTTAVADVIGGRNSAGQEVTQTTGQCFDTVDASLQQAIGQETREFRKAAGDGRDALSLLPFGAGLLAVLAAAGALFGIGRRLSEYR